MMRKSRWLLLLTLLAAVAAGCSSRRRADPSLAEVSQVFEIDRVMSVGRSQVSESLELVGSLIPWRLATIVSEVDGVIRVLPQCEKPLEFELDGKKYSSPITLDIGHEVKEGQVLIELDKRECQLALDAAQAKLALAKAELAKLEAWTRDEEVAQLAAQRDEAAALLTRAAQDLERCEELCKTDAVSESEHEAAKTAHAAAKAALERAEAALELAENGPTQEEKLVAEAQVKLAEAEVALRQDKLDKCTVHCPFDAVITDRYVGVGDRVTALPRVEIMQIADPSVLFAQVPVPEKYQHLVQVGDRAVVEAPDISAPVPAVVALVNEKIDPETRTFRVRVGVENKRRGLGADSGPWIFKPGSYVRVTLSLKSVADALVVPAEAVTFEEGNPAVFVFQGDRVEKRPVRLGISDRGRYEIVDGLLEGEQVVVGKTALLADGMSVRLRAAGPSPGDTARGRSSTGREASGAGDASLSLATDPVGAQP